MTTHEQFIHKVRDLSVSLAPIPKEQAETLLHSKLVYGRGETGLRGVTCYGAWQNGTSSALIEICAAAEESWIQLAGTTVHELAHAITRGAGHGKAWKDACATLGLRRVDAAGTIYRLANFSPALRLALAGIDKPADGTPMLTAGHLSGLNGAGGIILPPLKLRPCSAGIGTKGGKSRGPGSGSRLRKFVCDCMPPVIVRASRDELAAHCDLCGSAFNRV